ncbi:MAG: heavy metal-responsive transcriptional regulator [Dehalococcoidia bacterium]
MVTKKMQIGEAARETGVPPKTLRYYEEIGLVQPARTESGYREYDADALDRIQFIIKAKLLGFTLDEIADVLALKEDETEPCDHVLSLIDARLADIESRMRNLAELKTELESVRDKNEGVSSGPCTGTICHLIEDTPIRFQ